jgi:stringent starvation protein A
MNWWTSEPVAYTNSDYEGHRIRLLIAEKHARVVTRINDVDEFPESLAEVNPDNIYPVLIDKNLVCYGSALEELLHERFPSPTLLPVDPIKRAQVRMLANQVRNWYSLPRQELNARLLEVEEFFEHIPTLYMAGNVISIVDVALIPLLHEAVQLGTFIPGPHFQRYIQRVQSRPAFAQSLRSSTPASPEDELNDEAA